MTDDTEFDFNNFIDIIMDEDINYKIDVMERLTPIIEGVLEEVGEKKFVEVLSGSLMKVFNSKGVILGVRYSDEQEKRRGDIRTVAETSGIVGGFGHLYVILSSIILENPHLLEAMIEESMDIEYEEEYEPDKEDTEINELAKEMQKKLDEGE